MTNHDWRAVGFIPLYECRRCRAYAFLDEVPPPDAPVTLDAGTGRFRRAKGHETGLTCDEAAALVSVHES